MLTLDCRGQQCPQPVVQVRRQLLAAPDTPLQVLVGDAVARDNVGRLATSCGYSVAISEEDGAFRLELTPAGPAAGPAATSSAGPSVVLLASDQMGQGDPQLGRILLKNFLFTLAEGETTPDLLLFVNGGALLTVTGAEVLEPLRKLAGRGADIATCGLCLDFYGLKEQLAVGRVSNMFEIAGALQAAGRIIRP